MTPIATHLGRITIIRAPGDPMPAWLGGGCPERSTGDETWGTIDTWIDWPYRIGLFGPTLPTTEDRT